MHEPDACMQACVAAGGAAPASRCAIGTPNSGCQDMDVQALDAAQSTTFLTAEDPWVVAARQVSAVPRTHNAFSSLSVPVETQNWVLMDTTC